jgi:hypothetical protein
VTAVRVFYWASVIVCGVFAVPATSFLDTHRRVDLLWALGLLALGLALAVFARVRYFRLDPADRQPITPDSRRSVAIRLVLGIPIGVLGILALWAALATGGGVCYLLIAIAIIALGIWTLFAAWRKYRRVPSSNGGPAGP